MERKMKNIYEYFYDYTEEEINSMISNLTLEQKELIEDRYGKDLHNPVTSNSFSKDKSIRFYSYLVPKMRRLLAEGRIDKLNSSIKEEADLKAQLLELINNKKNNLEICETLNITNRQLYSLLVDLRNAGRMFSKKYYSNGSMQYKLIKTFQALEKSGLYIPDKTIITEPKENNMKFLVMSDLHFGNKLERLDLVNRAYNYCVKNGINIILLCGDLIDGTFSQEEQTILNVYDQIEYFINNYPYDKSILNFGVAGDHDSSAFTSEGLNIIEMCNNFRHDVVIGGFNNTGINIKNDQVLLHHNIKGGSLRSTDAPIILRGHSHKYKTVVEYDKLHVNVPSLSDIMSPMPTVLELNLIFNKGYITNANIKQIYFGSQDVVLSEAEFDLLTNRNINYDPVRNTEEYKIVVNEPVADEEKSPVKSLQLQPSQIEKFNKRYGR